MYTMTLPTFLPITETARRLGIETSQLRLLVKSGKIDAAQLPDGDVMVREDVLKKEPWDANYRRLLGDLDWPYTTPFAEILAYFPAPIVALRTVKAEIACGMQPGQAESVAAQDPDWMIAGHWGVVQFCRPKAD